MKYNPPIGAADPNDPYIDGNPGAGIEGSPVPAAALEHPMREIIKVITEAGITPDENDLTQLYQAIQALINANIADDASTTVKGIVELTTGPEALGGIDNTRAVTSAALASSQSKTISGYLKLSGGVIFQWGQSLAHLTPTSIAYNLAFPNDVLMVYSAGSNSNYVSVNAWKNNVSGFYAQSNGGGSPPYAFYWFAIGY